MADQSKYTLQDEAGVKSSATEWKAFVELQKERLLKRLKRYNNPDTAKMQLEELGDLSPYQHYKINTVSNYIRETLERVERGEYGTCKYCGKEIAFGRLLKVLAALQCVGCDAEHK